MGYPVRLVVGFLFCGVPLADGSLPLTERRGSCEDCHKLLVCRPLQNIQGGVVVGIILVAAVDALELFLSLLYSMGAQKTTGLREVVILCFLRRFAPPRFIPGASPPGVSRVSF